LDAPTTIASNQTEVAVKITLEAEQQCQINSVEVTLERHFTDSSANSSSPPSPQTLGYVKQSGPFILSPGQNQSLELSFTISGPDSGGKMAQTVGMLGNAISAFGNQSYSHYVIAKADVANIGLDPKDEQLVIWEGNEMPGITKRANINIDI